jgi:hypothetical protein
MAFLERNITSLAAYRAIISWNYQKISRLRTSWLTQNMTLSKTIRHDSFIDVAIKSIYVLVKRINHAKTPSQSRKALNITILDLSSTNQPLNFGRPYPFDLVCNLETIQLAGQSRSLVSIDFALDQLNIVQHSINH